MWWSDEKKISDLLCIIRIFPRMLLCIYRRGCDPMMIGTKQTMLEKEFVDYAMQLQNGTNAICTDLTKLVYTSPTPMHDLEKVVDHMKILIDLMARNANARMNSVIVDIKRARNFEKSKFKSNRK